jgi:hypothetical protein
MAMRSGTGAEAALSTKRRIREGKGREADVSRSSGGLIWASVKPFELYRYVGFISDTFL